MSNRKINSKTNKGNKQKKGRINSLPFYLYEKETGVIYDDPELWKEIRKYLDYEIDIEEINRLVELKRFAHYTEEFDGEPEIFYAQHKKEINKDTSKQSIFKMAFGINDLNKFKRSLKETYPDKFYDPEFRTEILEEQSRRCALCDADISSIEPHLHHIDYDKQNCSKDNLVFLCPRCHGKTNSKRNFWQGILKEYKEEK